LICKKKHVIKVIEIKKLRDFVFRRIFNK
jgi:hypothetical protein